MNNKTSDSQKSRHEVGEDALIVGTAHKGGPQQFLTDERLGKEDGREGGDGRGSVREDQRALVQTERDKSLPRKGQVY